MSSHRFLQRCNQSENRENSAESASRKRITRVFGPTRKKGACYNKLKTEDAHQPQCPADKEQAIVEALKAFGMISD